MNIITRRQWGAQPARSRPTGVRDRYWKIHWTDGCQHDHSRCDDTVRGIQDFHMGPSRGWSDIAYNYLVCEHGVVYEGRGRHVMSAANGDYDLNRGHGAIAFISALACPATPKAMGACSELLSELDAEEVKGHRDGYGTTCPGPKLYAWVSSGAWQVDDLRLKKGYWAWRAWKLGIGPWKGKGQKDAGRRYQPRIPKRTSPKWVTWWAKFVASGGYGK